MYIELKNTTLFSNWFGASDGITTVIASSVLQNFSIVTDDDYSHVINKNKLKRGKRINSTELQNHSKGEHSLFLRFHFDGKKIALLLLKKFTKNVFEEKEDYYSIIQEPSSMCVSHVSPSIGSDQNNANIITSYLRDIGFSLDDVDVIGCDNTLASQKVVCSKNRVGFIRIMQLSRLSMTSFSSRSYFNLPTK